MSRRIRIPWLVDIVRLDEPDAIAAATSDPRLDRDFAAGGGPLVNRILARRIRRIMVVDGDPLPSLAPKDYPGRAQRQRTLETELDRQLAGPGPAPGHLDRLAAYVRGEVSDEAIGPVVQEAVGRLFSREYTGTNETFEAAKTLNAAPRNINPLRAILWLLTGAIRRARNTLAAPVAGNTQAVHATAIAVHTLVRNLEAMRALHATSGAREQMTTPIAVARSLRAPTSVLRRWSEPATTTLGDMRAGTFALVELDKARLRHPGCDVVFMSNSWSRCPAYHWCEALLAAVWERAAPPAQPEAGP